MALNNSKKRTGFVHIFKTEHLQANYSIKTDAKF